MFGEKAAGAEVYRYNSIFSAKKGESETLLNETQAATVYNSFDEI